MNVGDERNLTSSLTSFIKSLHTYPHDTFREILIKYGLSPILKLVKLLRLPHWIEFFKLMLEEDSFILIVLDACRYDFFYLFYEKYFHGKLTAVRSEGTHTYGWLPKAFSHHQFKDIKVFYAKLAISTHDVKLKEFVPVNRNVEVIEVRPREMSDLGAVSPWEINDEVLRRGLRERNIIWYMQPHYPWIHYKELSLKLMNEVMWHDFTPRDLVKEKLKHEGINRQKIVKAYISNLVEVLDASSVLLREVKGDVDKIVITADHGELLGEYGLYLHPHYELPQLCIVPWLEVEEVT